MKISLFKNYIEKYENILSNSECEYYINLYESSESKKLLSSIGNYSGVAVDLKQEVQLTNKISIGIDRYKLKYKFLNGMPHVWGIQSWCNLQKYSPGNAYYGEHMEHGPNNYSSTRVLAWMIYLNTVKHGGGTRWPQQNYTSKSKAGSLIIWPASWTHSHYGIVATKECKYILTGWCSFV